MKNFKILLFIFLLFIIGCKKQESVQTYDYTPQPNALNKVYRNIKINLDKNGTFEFITLTTESNKNPADTFYFFDEVNINIWDKYSNNYRTIFTDTVYFGSDIFFKDINNDSINEIIVKTNSGGIDSINSIGLKIYSYNNGSGITKLFDSEYGNPKISDINNDGICEIISYNSINNEICGVSSISIITKIYSLGNNKYSEQTIDFATFCKKVISEDSSEYSSLKNQKIIVSNSLYSVFLKYILENELLNKNTFELYHTEKNYLFKKLNDDQILNLLLILNNRGMEFTNQAIDSISEIIDKKVQNLINNRNYIEANKSLEKLLVVNPQSIDFRMKFADVLFMLGKYDESLDNFGQLLFYKNDDKKIFLGMGRNYEMKKDIDNAISYYKKYLEYDSTSVDAVKIKETLKKLK